ncbi:Hydroxyacylglutathione hydrolase [Carpediemonas membranifera]|uniref:hydroxyacylglutathione hydrolase n=1 Tax=Carpediemonas membranifera TaxID=201153 RepID=A0A8J6B6V3_9EUKA|nr:Hydroxyacylglutathione hydrolase [Carpediemonas membranifera]|eukprot:KAG9395509.1 Hydroxyacylglutathione hydrolase [Carpediemonas membranifera]
MDSLSIHIVPVLKDNYVYLIVNGAEHTCIAVDPGVSRPILAKAEELGCKLTHILNTHCHWDHCDGNIDLKNATACYVVGSRHDAARIPGIDRQVVDGDVLRLCGVDIHVLGTPGHTTGDVSYFCPDLHALFPGDSLFPMGCGRLFEGTPGDMWQSMQKLKALPGDTKVYSAHEYTVANSRFAAHIDPHNPAVKAAAERAKTLRGSDECTLPVILGDELQCNPFLRADEPEFQKELGMEGMSAVEVFAHVRRTKDGFKG